MRRGMTTSLCRCGHPFVSHEHLRRGTDCAWCEPGSCRQFQTPGLLERLRGRLGPGAGETDQRSRPALVLVR